MQALFLVPSNWAEWKHFLRDQFPEAVVIIVAVIAVNIVFRRVVSRILHTAITRAAATRREDRAAIERRADTLVATINWLFAIFIIFVGSALVLDNLGLNVSALVASVGIAGLALGLGAQTLIKDVINGTFILLEDQYGVGDVVTVAGISGQVIEINPRRTVLRDQSGNVHSVPNSAITVATNMTQGFSRINLDVTVPRQIETLRAVRLVNEACEALAAEHPDEVLSTAKVLRIDALTEGGVILKVVGDVKAGRQWDLTGELRLRIKTAFDAAGDDLLRPLTPVVVHETSGRPPDGESGPSAKPSGPAKG
ncbi:MAG: mechanosensitive ion channel family protein [Hyphomicrobiales bacterium]